MNIGHIIKIERTKLGIKQIVLAKGICSPSYLSKIEQDQITASKEILSLLLERLGIPLDEIKKKKAGDNGHLLKQIVSSYKEVVTKRSADFAKKQLQILGQDSNHYEEKELYYTLNLVLLRFKLIADEELSGIRKEIDYLKKQVNEFNESQEFLLIVNEGILYYKSNMIQEAISMFERALEMDSPIEQWELAEINYMIGLAYTSDNRTAASIHFIQKALDYFKSKFLMKRVIDCYTLKGIFYKRANNFEKAEDCYFQLIDLCNKFNLLDRLGSIYHNLGSLYLVNGNKEEGFLYLHRSLEYKTNNRSKLTTILALVSEYAGTDNRKKVLYWCDHGLTLCETILDDSIVPFLHHFNFYKATYGEIELTEETVKRTLEYFENLQDYQHAQKYSIIFAEKLFKLRKYKLSATFFCEANRFGYLHKNINILEDM